VRAADTPAGLDTHQPRAPRLELATEASTLSSTCYSSKAGADTGKRPATCHSCKISGASCPMPCNRTSPAKGMHASITHQACRPSSSWAHVASRLSSRSDLGTRLARSFFSAVGLSPPQSHAGSHLQRNSMNEWFGMTCPWSEYEQYGPAAFIRCPSISPPLTPNTSQESSPKFIHFLPGLCPNSPYSAAPWSSSFTSCSTRGRRVTMPVPRGRKSRPTTASSTELLPELCHVQNRRSAGARPQPFGIGDRCTQQP
jgi:hypothetical protein